MFVFAPQKELARSLNKCLVAVLVWFISKQRFVTYFFRFWLAQWKPPKIYNLPFPFQIGKMNENIFLDCDLLWKCVVVVYLIGRPQSTSNRTLYNSAQWSLIHIFFPRVSLKLTKEYESEIKSFYFLSKCHHCFSQTILAQLCIMYKLCSRSLQFAKRKKVIFFLATSKLNSLVQSPWQSLFKVPTCITG